jgi:polysaccharide biosynthesis transport protein
MPLEIPKSIRPEGLVERPAAGPKATDLTAHARSADRWSAASPSEPLVRVSWARYAAALRRYKWLVLVVILVGATLGFAATRLLQPEYEVHSTLWISSGDSPDERDRAAPIRAGELMRQTAWPDLLTSFAILERVARRMSLHVQPKPSDATMFSQFATDSRFRPGKYKLKVDESGRQYKLTTDDGAQLASGVVGDSIGRSLGFLWQPPAALLPAGRTVAFTLLTPREAALRLRTQLTVNFSRESNLLGVTLKGNDPVRTATVMSTLLDEFMNAAAELKKHNISTVTKVLKQQLDYADKDLKTAESELQSFLVRTIALPSINYAVTPPPSSTGTPGSESGDQAAGNAVVDTYFKRQVEYDDIRRDREGLESTLAAIEQGTLDPSALWSVAVVERNAPLDLKDKLNELSAKEAALRAAQRTYTDDHSTVRDLKQQVDELRTRTIPRIVTGLIAELKQRETGLAGQLQGTMRQLRDIPARTIDEGRLRRNLGARSALYTTLKNRYEEAVLAEASTVPDVQILDAPAAPEHPTSNRAPLIVLLAIFLSAGFAAALAIVLDRVDKRFRYAEQATNELGLDVIGAIPAVAGSSLSNPEKAAQLVEGVRSIRLSLTHAFDVSERILLTISSPGPGEGKSFLSSQLAVSFAQAGCKTLLIDGDTRRGELHARFAVDRRPGLLDYLAGDATLESVLRSTSFDNLTLMPRGVSNDSGPELLTSPTMSDLISELESRFHVVIVDSPPLGAGIDPYVLGTVTGKLLLVLRSGETDRRIAEAKLKLLHRLPIELVGAVLNDFQEETSFAYYTYLHGDGPDDAAPLETRVADLARKSGLASLRKL